MQKLKTALMALVATLAVLFGGIGATAPASAEENAVQAIRSVYYPYNGNLSGVPLVVNMQDGRTLYRYRDTVTDNVWRYCPPSINYFLVVENPEGHRVTRSRGTCHVPSQDGQYKAWVKRVN